MSKLDVASVAILSLVSKDMYRMTWTDVFLRTHTSLTGRSYYKQCWKLFASTWHGDIHSYYCQAASWRMAIEARHMQRLDRIIQCYGYRFCQYYVEDMLAQFPQATMAQQQELIDEHQHFCLLFQGRMVEETLYADRDVQNIEPMRLDIYQLPDKSWVEYTPLQKMLEEVLVQIISRLDWVDRTIMSSLHPSFSGVTRSRQFGAEYVRRWGDNYANPCRTCFQSFYTWWHREVHRYCVHKHILTYAQ